MYYIGLFLAHDYKKKLKFYNKNYNKFFIFIILN